MPLWKRACSTLVFCGALLGCQAGVDSAAGVLGIDSARVSQASDGSVLEAAVDFRPSEAMREALDHGIPLTLSLQLDAEADGVTLRHARLLELRYFPLSRRYQLRDDAGVGVHSFAASGYLLDALGALRLPLPGEFSNLPDGSRLTLKVTLDRGALPGALRLPAMLQSVWRVADAEYTWTVAG